MELENLYKSWTPRKREKFKAYLASRLKSAMEEQQRLSERRRLDYQLYRHRKLGRLLPRQANLVMSNVMDTVETMMPLLMELLGVPDVIQIGPEKDADLEAAEKNQRVWEYQMEHELGWFMVLYEWIKATLIYGDGHVEWGWETIVTYEDAEFEVITSQDAREILAKGGMFVEGRPIVAVDEMGNKELVGFAEAKFKERVVKKHGPFVEVVPPEDVILDEGSREVGRFGARVIHTNLDQVLKDGQRRGYFGLQVLKNNLKSQADGVEIRLVPAVEQIRQEREHRFEQMGQEDPKNRPASYYPDAPGLTPLTVYRIYCDWDIDGDGLLEPVMVYWVAEADHVLGVYTNPYGRVPIESMAGMLDPFQPYNISIPQLMEQSQRLMTALIRGIVDIMRLALKPIKLAERGRGTDMVALKLANAGDVVMTDPGGLNSIRTLDQPKLPSQVWPLIQWLESRDEKRSGVTSYNQGTDASSLNKTATGLVQILQQSQKRIALIAQVMARTGIIRLVKKIVWMNQNFMKEPKSLYLASEGGETTIDPAELRGRFNLSVNVSPGGGRQAAFQTAQQIMGLITDLAKSPYGQAMVGPENVYHVARMILAAIGRHDIDKIIRDPRRMAYGGAQAPGLGGYPGAHHPGGVGPAVPGEPTMARGGEEMGQAGVELLGGGAVNEPANQ